ncbi:MAG: hypothetical protein M3H12_09800 [Chromatiales bacterium]|nr:hypothetical protein [Gammaproteobacteria bacterium]
MAGGITIITSHEAAADSYKKPNPPPKKSNKAKSTTTKAKGVSSSSKKAYSKTPARNYKKKSQVSSLNQSYKKFKNYPFPVSKFNLAAKSKWSTQSSSKVNHELTKEGYRAPYTEDSKKNVKVFTFKTSKDHRFSNTTQSNRNFIRVYSEGNSRKEGRWIMREKDIRGLTAQQIQNKFSLPYKPTHIASVDIPKGTSIRFGIVGMNYGYKGGGKQYELFDKNKVIFRKLRKIK